jgi:hypothetical protein
MGDYLDKHGYKAGHAVWKFQFKTNVIYRNKNHHALKLYWNNRDRNVFSVYVRSLEGWKFVVNHTPSEKCKCGREYNDTPNGESFRFQAHPLVFTIESVSNVMCSPTLCMICYYTQELKKGRWAPKHVKKTLGLET